MGRLIFMQLKGYFDVLDLGVKVPLAPPKTAVQAVFPRHIDIPVVSYKHAESLRYRL
jgi:hypothetical protein